MREVPALTLDDAVERHGRPDFIKIDVEGHEVKVIEGGKQFFAENSPALFIEVHGAELGVQVRDLLPGYKWERFDHTDAPDVWLENHYWLRGTR